MTFRELRLTRRLNWRNAFSYLRVREAILASLGIWTTIESKELSGLWHAFLAQEIAAVCGFRIQVALMGYSFFVDARLIAIGSAERKRFDDSGKQSYDGDRKRL